MLSVIQDYGQIRMKYSPDFPGEALCEAKVCFTTLEVIINDFVRDKLLLQPGDLDNDAAASVFDLWWHAQLLSLAIGFNAV